MNIKSLIKRTLSGIIFFVVMVLCSLYQWTFLLSVLFVSTVIFCEYFNLSIEKTQYKVEKLLALLSLNLLLVILFLSRKSILPDELILLSFLPIIVILIRSLYREENKALSHIFYPFVYIALPFASAIMLTINQLGEFDYTIYLYLFFIIWSNDVGAYVFGMTFGQKNGHKLFPSVSPKKSWEGVIGGAFVALLITIFLRYIHWIELPILHSLILTLLIIIFSTYGDLVESKLKRAYGVKDSGNIMPGHGGLLDRFDGALFAIPIALIYLTLFALI